jgi:hypothetical protein
MKAARKRATVNAAMREQHLVIIDAVNLRKAEKLIKSCEHCNPERSQIPFVVILDRITDSDPAVADYEVGSARCSACNQIVVEKTLVEPSFGSLNV